MPGLVLDAAHLLAGGLVLVSFMMLYQDRLHALINVYALHALVLALSVAWQAYIQHTPELYVTAAIALVFKAVIIPVALHRIIRRLGIHREVETAVGIGLTMLAHCDLVFVSSSARLRAPFASMGVAPEAGSSVALPLRIGWQQTAHLFFSSAWLDPQGALDCGLAWKVCEPDALLDDTLAEARHIAAMPVASLVATKQLMLAGRLDAVRNARTREGEVFRRLLESRD